MDPLAQANSATAWRLAGAVVMRADRPRIVAIINVTPDSFADDGRRLEDPGAAAEAACLAIAGGAELIDIGGESTRPGAEGVSAAEQIRRVVPVIDRLRRLSGTLSSVPISVDTTLAGVAQAAIDAGANAVNDVSGGEDPAMFPLVARSGVGLVLMHRAHAPREDRYSDRYETPPITQEITGVVVNSLRDKLHAALHAGVEAERVLLDPGLGFGKSVAQNLALISATHVLLGLGRPVLSALSRKSFVGRAGLGRDSTPQERLPATLALSVLHMRAGARFFRVHDVQEHRQALEAAFALENAGCGLPE
jgi:dihydropteroate synthase